ncbi:YitT family protein [Massilicoli timonensis]
MMRNVKELVWDYGIVIIGNFLLAAGVVLFILPNDVLTGGVAGIAVALFPIFHIPTDLMINALTIALFVLGALTLGKQFAIKTLLSTICYPVFISVLSSSVHAIEITDNQLLASIYGGVLMGAGVGLVFRTGASTGGMDIPPLIVNKITKWPLPTLVLVTDGLTVLLGALVYGVEAALIGIISVWLSSYVIDKTMMFGGQATKNVMIISKHQEEILQVIYQDLGRGATILEAKGSYTSENRPVLMVCVSKKQYPLLSHEISRIDPEAFVIVMDANEVQGYGFSYLEEM